MSEQTPLPASGSASLPDAPNLNWLRKQSKRTLSQLRKTNPAANGVDPSARWNHWGAEVTPLHLAILGKHPEVVRVLLAAGADPTIRDTQHKATATEWAEFFGHKEIVRILAAHEAEGK